MASTDVNRNGKWIQVATELHWESFPTGKYKTKLEKERTKGKRRRDKKKDTLYIRSVVRMKLTLKIPSSKSWKDFRLTEIDKYRKKNLFTKGSIRIYVQNDKRD